MGKSGCSDFLLKPKNSKLDIALTSGSRRNSEMEFHGFEIKEKPPRSHNDLPNVDNQYRSIE
jgi:hypothetical protein